MSSLLLKARLHLMEINRTYGEREIVRVQPITDCYWHQGRDSLLEHMPDRLALLTVNRGYGHPVHVSPTTVLQRG